MIKAVTDEYEFVLLKPFIREFKKLKLNDNDLAELKVKLVEEEPEADLGSNVYKFRWAPSRWNTGQSGATRVIYVDVIRDSKAYLVSIYGKNKKSNLGPTELKGIRELGKLLSKGGLS